MVTSFSSRAQVLESRKQKVVRSKRVCVLLVQSFFLYCIGNSELIKAPAFVICVFMTKYQMSMLKAYFMFHTLHLHRKLQ